MKLLATATAGVVAVAVLVGLAASGARTPPSSGTCPPPHPGSGTSDRLAVLAAGALEQTLTSELPPDPAAILAAAGLHRPDVQLPHADLIVAVGTQLGAPPRAQVIAVATAMQETRLRNLANPVVPESLHLPNDGVAHDHDSVGLFQQRPSTGWGAPHELMDPTYATNAFYTRLLALPGWETMALTQAAQAVQRSAFPDAYARWEPLATALVATTPASPCGPPAGGDVVVLGDYALPVPRSAVPDPTRLLTPHHDYPAWDLGLPEGTPIYAPATGTIIAVTTTGACGWGIVLQDPQGLQWNLCHGTPNTTNMTTGQHVTAGQTLFLSGNTGNSTGPHIHLGIRTPNGTRLCPQQWLHNLWNQQPSNPAALPTAGCTSGPL